MYELNKLINCARNLINFNKCFQREMIYSFR